MKTTELSIETLQIINDWISEQDYHVYLDSILEAVEELDYADLEVSPTSIIDFIGG